MTAIVHGCRSQLKQDFCVAKDMYGYYSGVVMKHLLSETLLYEIDKLYSGTSVKWTKTDWDLVSNIAGCPVIRGQTFLRLNFSFNGRSL